MTKEEIKLIEDLMYAYKNGTHFSESDINKLEKLIDFLGQLKVKLIERS